MNGRSFSIRSSTRPCARRCVPLRIVKWTRDVGFSTIDYLTLIAYLAGITLFGMRFRRAQRTVRDYFIGARTTSWVVISLSIVATETSTLTLIGVPALVYSDFARPEQGGSFMYLQVVLGYIVARFIISWILIPAYFQGELLTAYALLERRFGAATKHVTASLFLVMRGFVVLFQFVLFLTIGAMLFAYYQSHPRPALTSNDEIFPAFIVQILPRGIAGLVIAAIFAAAMSNLSGSLNSLASTSIFDFYQPLARRRHSDARLL